MNDFNVLGPQEYKNDKMAATSQVWGSAELKINGDKAGRCMGTKQENHVHFTKETGKKKWTKKLIDGDESAREVPLYLINNRLSWLLGLS